MLQASGWLLGLVMTMCLLFPVGMLVMAVVDEKEHRLKQTLKISGLTHASWAGGWYALGRDSDTTPPHTHAAP